ncbi:heat shock protein DnaJ domain-containing protein [Oscillochloris trichoides DG-6]|uniref:Heat shock protein DnaJ domain-containing protein n=1 Tax=Oscillochloris trichoides DG-6 TaxID=765420 RepID=E1ICC4_9CHLR|nr:DnaJ domain-containing protein [Oscillochloris trichoides]EFO81178.1 heat shock protein DnaJ domain-containing protein [Oscillochloris trichoides DG-6]
MQDYYETLQVHPKADPEAIRAAYERLQQRYAAALLEGAADELRELARQRREEIERAYAVLSDPAQRARFDQELQQRTLRSSPDQSGIDPQDDDLIDYRPLSPAQGQERPKGFNTQPYLPPSQAPRRSGRRIQSNSRFPVWLPTVLIVAVSTFAIVLITLITTVARPQTQATATQAGTPTAAPPSTDQMVNQFEGQITMARQVALQVSDNPKAWVELGNALFDSTVIVRELIDSGHTDLQALYVERLPRWLEARDAYTKALELKPDDAIVRADMAAALCYYGAGVNDQSYVVQGLAEADRALSLAPEEGRALLSKGVCLIMTDPPQTQAALEQWQRIVILPNVDAGLVTHARQLITTYSQ